MIVSNADWCDEVVEFISESDEIQESFSVMNILKKFLDNLQNNFIESQQK